MKVSVEEEACCGAGQCVMLAPDVFDQRDDDGIVILLEQQPAESLHSTVREAASMCPAGAIQVNESA